LKCFSSIYFSLFVGQKSVEEIERTVKGADVQLMLLDLSSLNSVRDFAANLLSTVDKAWNFLVNIQYVCTVIFWVYLMKMKS